VRAVVTGIGQARHVEFDRVATFVASGRKATKDETENNAAHLSSPGLARMRDGSLPAIAAPVNIAPHIPLKHVHESARLLRRMGGEVTEQIYDGMGHTINDDEMNLIRDLARG
jgi:hypothetical protein